MKSVLDIQTQCVSGKEITNYIHEMGTLRVDMFHEYPYLYEGTLAYEEEYLNIYAQSDNSLIVMVRDKEKLVGMLTGLPLADWFDIVFDPFEKAGYNPSDVYYIGEGMLLEPYRGKFSYTPLIEKQEVIAKRVGAKYISFCTVNRPDNHPQKPKDYRPLNGVWKRLGYRECGVIAEFEWTDVGETQPTKKPMQFWLKKLP